MSEAIQRGGWLMGPIVFAFLIGAAIAIERFFVLRKASRSGQDLLRAVLTALETDSLEAALKRCQAEYSPLAHILHAGLLRLSRGIDQVENAIERAGAIEAAYLEKNLVWLSYCAISSPMLGFLGTALGLIGMLDGISNSNEIVASRIASGVADSLYPMVFGLGSALLLGIAQKYFVESVDKIIFDLEESSQLFIDSLEGAGGINHRMKAD